MKDQLAEIMLKLPAAADQHEFVALYWDAYRNLVAVAHRDERQKIMQWLASGAYLEVASLISGRAFPDLLWQVRSNSKEHPRHSAAIFDGAVGVAFAISNEHAGHALLSALVQHVLKVRNTMVRSA